MKRITKVSNRIIRRFDPCYDPAELGIKESEYLPIAEAVEKYRDAVKNKEDIIWLLCREQFMSDKDMRLFAVWCAREALKLVDNPDRRSVNACDVAERFANGEATRDERDAAWSAACAAAWSAASAAAKSVAWDAARAAAWCADRDVASAAARYAARAAARCAAEDAARSVASDAQIDKLLTCFLK